MEKIIQTKLKLKVSYDNDAYSPISRKYDDGILGTFVCFHSRYDLGNDDNEYVAPIGFFLDLAHKIDSYRTDNIDNAWMEGFIDEDQAMKSLKKIIDKDDNIVMLPLYLYDHSGIAISTSSFACPWDSGQVGYVYTTKERCDELGINYNIDNVEKMLNDEVELYNTYLQGNVFGFEIVEYDEEYGNEYDVVDSCWGFYGTDMKENGMIDNMNVSKEILGQILTNGYDAYNYMN